MVVVIVVLIAVKMTLDYDLKYYIFRVPFFLVSFTSKLKNLKRATTTNGETREY